MQKKSQHVTPNSKGGWNVRKAGATKATSIYSTQQEAIQAATRIAQNQRTDLYIHGRDGRIREHNSYEGSPPPPRG